MANVSRKTPFDDIKSSSSLAFEEFVPPSAWTEDATSHYLLVDLPGFKKEELRLQVDNETHILVSGERQVRNNKYKRFEQTFELPKDADFTKITGKLDGEILYISVPKQPKQQHEELQHGRVHEAAHEANIDHHKSDKHKSTDAIVYNKNGNNENLERDKNDDDDDDDDEKSGFVKRRDWEGEAELLVRIVVEKLRKNKGVVMTAIFAFSLGVLVQKLQSNGQ